MRARPLLTTVTAAVLLLTACETKGNGNQAGSPGTTTATSSATSTAPGSATSSSAAPSTGRRDDAEDGDAHPPPFQADTSRDTGQPSAGAYGNITEIRIGHHDGFDRVVFEFHGTGTPGWTAEYVPQAVADASGKTIPLGGNAVLQVSIIGVGYPTETGVQEAASGTLAVAGTDVVTQVYFNGTFEGISQALVGTTAKQPFRAYLLTAPARVVVEIVSP